MLNHVKGYTARIEILNGDMAAQQELFEGIRKKDATALKAGINQFNLAMHEYGNMIVDNSRGMVKLSQADNFPTQPSAVVQVFFEGSEEAADVTWTQLAAVEDFRNTTEDSFSMIDVSNAITFRSYKNGEQVELYAVSGTEVKFPFELVGGGFQWLQTWLDDNKYWRLSQGFSEAATQYAKEQAQNFYEVLTAAGYDTQARVATPAGAPEAYYDIATINQAYVAMLSQLKANSGYAAPAPRMYLVYNSLEEGIANRIPQLGTEFRSDATGTIRLNPNITLVGTPNVTGGGFWLVLPGRKLRSAIRMDMTGFDHFDIFSYSGARVFWGRYNHVRGDSDQVRFIPLS